MTEVSSKVVIIDEQAPVTIGLNKGLKAGIVAMIATAGGVYLANNNFEKFRTRLSISAKASFPIMAALFFGTLVTELTIHDAKVNPSKYGLDVSKAGDNIIFREEMNKNKPQYKSMPIHHKVANYVYDYPMVMIGGMGVPMVAAIFLGQNDLQHLSLSQKIMKSRVFGQFGVLSICVVTFMFRFYMNKRGKFPDPNKQVESDSSKYGYGY